jgi:serine/threonine protein kinase
VKQLQKREEVDSAQGRRPNRETAAYKRLNQKRNPHIVRLLATYFHKGHLHMIFPWADGNLFEFWKSHYPTTTCLPRSCDLAKWAIKQISGLATALLCIHDSAMEDGSDGLKPGDGKKTHGRHGDLKPQNILWFKDASAKTPIDALGNLVISDLGSTEFHGTLSKTVHANAAGGFTETYKAPEYDFRQLVSPQADIWSLGCMLLEFVVWYMRGWAGVKDFSDARIADSNFVIQTDQFFNFDKRYNVVEAKASVRKV